MRMGRSSLPTACAAALAALIGVSAPASSQSLFNQPTAQDPQPEAQPEGPAAAPKPRPKPKRPTPARSLVISNASSNTLTSLEVSGDGQTARLTKPLVPKERTTLKLPALKRCIVTVSADFEGAAEAAASDFNVCREKIIRFTE